MKKLIVLLSCFAVFGFNYPFDGLITVLAETYEMSDFEHVIKPGKYKVGTNLDPGEYKIYSLKDSAYFAILADSNGDDILHNSNFKDVSYVTVMDGEYLELSRCFMVPFDENETRDEKLKIFNGGTYKVGHDLEAGEYYIEVAVGKDKGYWAIKDSSASNQDIVSNENFENQSFVTVEDGQYLTLSRSFIDLDNQ